MALAHFQRTFTDDAGNVKPALSVTARRESDNGLAALFSDAAGGTSKSNPFDTDANGYGSFYAADGRYRIQATDVDWRNEDLISQPDLATSLAAISTNTSDIATKTEKPSETTITGTATFLNSANNIALSGIGIIDLEIGDVVTISGTVSNNKESTVEVITDANNIIVNQAHAGGTTSKSLVNETASATVTLLVKWYNAAPGLGQGWVNTTGSRSASITYTNLTKRSIMVSIYEAVGSAPHSSLLLVDALGISTNADGGSNNKQSTKGALVPPGSTYEWEAAAVLSRWLEMR